MKFLLAAIVAVLSITSAEAYPGRGWYGRDYDRMRTGRPIYLGSVNFGSDEWSNRQPQMIYVYNHPQIQCGMTHLRLYTQGDSAVINAIEVEYRDADRYGNRREMIDLRDDDDYGRAWGRTRDNRGPNGIFLAANDSTPWLDVDDVMDGYPDGRCIQSIRVYGYDYPPRQRPGSNRRYPRWGYYNPRAYVYVEGLILDRRPPHYNPGHGGHHDHPGHNPPAVEPAPGPVVAPPPAPPAPNGRPGTYPGPRR